MGRIHSLLFWSGLLWLFWVQWSFYSVVKVAYFQVQQKNMLSCFHELVVVGEKGEVCDCLVCFSFFVYNCGFFSSSQKWMISKFQRNMWSCFHGWWKRKSWRLFCLFFLFCLQLCFFSSSQKWMTSMFQRNMWSCFHVGGKGKVGDCFVCFSLPVVSARRHFVIATNN